jgi:hypothetical protein
MYSRSVCTIFLFTLLLFGTNSLGFGQQPMRTSVYGGEGGSLFADIEIPTGARVQEVYVFCGEYVDAVQISFMLPDGRSVLSPRHGGSGGQQHVFRLDSNEYIVGLSGRYGTNIDSIQIRTNKRTSQPFGGSGGNRDYRVDVTPGNQAVGFVGRAGSYLDAIGLTFIPLRRQAAEQETVVGGSGGSTFSDSEIPAGARITEVRVHSGDFIDSIQMVYMLENGRLFEGPVHGGRGGRTSVFRLDPDEHIIGIAGRYGTHIDSLAILTNKRTSPTFGGRGGRQDFRLVVPEGDQVIGLSGRSGEFLDALGLNSIPIRSQKRDFQRRRRR